MILSLALSLLGCAAAGSVYVDSASDDIRLLQTGDVIFQMTDSEQSIAIALASGSAATHAGIVVVESGEVTVIEAGSPVREIPIERFIRRTPIWGASRLREEVGRGDWAEGVVSFARERIGTPYDQMYKWNDDKLYCSELVWKAYLHAAEVELAPMQRVGDLNLTSGPVQALIRERMGDAGPDLEEMIVTPASLHDSDLLYEIIPMF